MPLVVFNKVPLIVLTGVILEIPPLKPDPVGTLHVYVVPLGTIPLMLSTGVTLNVTPPQAVPVIGVITAVGFKVNVKINDAPVPHAAVDGVMV